MSSELRPGYRCGDYELLAFIGQGGMAQVWSARSVSKGELVAIKALLPAYAENGVLRERLLREGQSQNMLQHQNILRSRGTYEWGRSIFMVMELVDGESLERYIQRRRIMPVPEVRGVAQSVLSALSHAHDHQIVHRDVKPSNILLSRKGRILLGDFGIALLQNSIRLTRFGGMGTPSYMSPEQIVGRDIDHRSDLYSVGCVLYELLTGAPPFPAVGSDANDVVRRAHQKTLPEPLIPKNPDVPAALEKAVLRALEKLPADRFESSAAFAAALGVSIHVAQPDQERAPAAAAKSAVQVVFPQGYDDGAGATLTRVTPAPITPAVEMPRAGTPAGTPADLLQPGGRVQGRVSGPGLTRFHASGGLTAKGLIARRPLLVGGAAIAAAVLLAALAVSKWRSTGPVPSNGATALPAPGAADARKAGPAEADLSPDPVQDEPAASPASDAASDVPVAQTARDALSRALGQLSQTAPERVPAPDAPVGTALTPGVFPSSSRPPPLAPPPGASVRSSGVLQWVGTRGDEVEIDGSTASKGVLSGDALPGVPVAIAIEGDNGSVIQLPADADGYRRLILRSAATHLRIHWKTLATGQAR